MDEHKGVDVKHKDIEKKVSHMDKQIGELPYGILRKIAMYLDINDAWKALISEMPSGMYSLVQVSFFEMERARMSGSPSMALLTDLTQKCVTVEQLAVWLKKCGNHAALDILGYNEELKIIEQPKSQQVHVGGTVTLRCKATGYPAPMYRWFKDGKVLRDRIDEELTWDPVTVHDNGKYYCVVSSRVNEEKSNTVDLQVLPSADGAELPVLAVYQATTRKSGKQWKVAGMEKETPKPKAAMQELALVPVTSFQRETSATTACLRVHVDCESITGPGLPGRGVPSAQEVLDFIRFKFFKSAGPRELEEVNSKVQSMHCSDAVNSLEEECRSSPVIETVTQVKDTGMFEIGIEKRPPFQAADGPHDVKGVRIDLTSPTAARETSTSEDVLNLIASSYLSTIKPSSSAEFNGFLDYLTKVRQVLINNCTTGSLIITAECRSLEIVDDLWKSYCTGYLNEMAQFLVTEDLLKAFGLIEVKLITTIVEQEYQNCREVFLKQGAELGKTLEIKAGNCDQSDDDDRFYDSNKREEQLEKTRQPQQKTDKDVSRKPSISREPGELLGDRDSDSSFPSKVATPQHPECPLNAEGNVPACNKDNSPWTVQNVLSSIVTSNGGIVNGEGIRLVCPPGVVDSPMSVSVALEDPSSYYGFLIRKDLQNDIMFGSPIINLQPNGYFFKKPVTLTTKFQIQDLKCSDVLVFHGKETGVGKITWEDITHNTKIDEKSQEVTIELEHFSPIVVLLRWTWIRAEDILSRFNLRSFHYVLTVLLRKCSSWSDEVQNEFDEELALLFVSQDVYHEQFYKEQETSALVQLGKEKFVNLHVRCSDTEGKRSIYNNERLNVEIHIGEDYELADSQQESTKFSVLSSVWWNVGEVIRLPLKANQDIRSLCGTITVQGEYGHVSTWYFREKDLCGYVRRLLGVEDVIFNLIPIAKSLDMPEEVMNQVTKCWKDEDKQLDIILEYWSRKKNVAENLEALRRGLDKFKQDHTSYKVTKRGQMHIRNLRECPVKNADTRLFGSLCTSVLRDLCIEMESSVEDVGEGASSTDPVGRFLESHSYRTTENRRRMTEDIAVKYRQVCSLSKKPSLETVLAVIPHLIQNVKEIFVDYESMEPQNGLRGLSGEKIDLFVLNAQKAGEDENFYDLVYQMCQILEKLCHKNIYDEPTAKIKEWSRSLGIGQMLQKLEQFFGHSEQDIRLRMRLHLFSLHLRDIMTKRVKIDEIYVYPVREICNVLLSLIHFAKYDPSKVVRFGLTDTANSPLSCYRENVTYDKRENVYCQRFRVKKESEDPLQLFAVARVHTNGHTQEKGAFQSEIMLCASGEKAFDSCVSGLPDIAVMKLKHKCSGNLRVVLSSAEQEKLLAVQEALKLELRQDQVNFRRWKITRCRLKLCSNEYTAGAVLSLHLMYKWGSEAVILDRVASRDFMTCAYCPTDGACTPEISLTVQMMSGEVFSLVVNSSDSVESVKAKIFESRGYPPGQQRLVFRWQNLEDHLSLSDYGVDEESTQESPVYLVPRLRDRQ